MRQPEELEHRILANIKALLLVLGGVMVVKKILFFFLSHILKYLQKKWLMSGMCFKVCGMREEGKGTFCLPLETE